MNNRPDSSSPRNTEGQGTYVVSFASTEDYLRLSPEPADTGRHEVNNRSYTIITENGIVTIYARHHGRFYSCSFKGRELVFKGRELVVEGGPNLLHEKWVVDGRQVTFGDSIETENEIARLEKANQTKVETTYNRLLEITKNYLIHEKESSGLNPNAMQSKKREEFEKLYQALVGTEDKPTPSLCRINAFYATLLEIDDNTIKKHQTKDWKRYMYNALSILVLFIFRAYKSNDKYGSLSFWKPDSEKAVIGMKSEVEGFGLFYRARANAQKIKSIDDLRQAKALTAR